MEVRIKKAPFELGSLPISAAAEQELSAATGVSSDSATRLFLEQVLSACLELHGDRGETTEAVLDLLTELQPNTALEGMLVTQMVACHVQAMAQMKKAVRSNAAAAVEQHLKLAQKLQRLFLSQIESLERLRGRRNQHVRVEHVHVHQGGQAIVGQVAPSGGGGG